MNVEIRICALEDASAIYELNKQEMWYDYPIEKTTEKLKQLLKGIAVLESQVLTFSVRKEEETQ